MFCVVVAPRVTELPDVARLPNQNIGIGLPIGYVALIVISKPTPLSVELGNCAVFVRQLLSGLQVTVALRVCSVTFSSDASKAGAWCSIVEATSSTRIVQLLPAFVQVRPCVHA